jgi:hypothetical protein
MKQLRKLMNCYKWTVSLDKLLFDFFKRRHEKPLLLMVTLIVPAVAPFLAIFLASNEINFAYLRSAIADKLQMFVHAQTFARQRHRG